MNEKVKSKFFEVLKDIISVRYLKHFCKSAENKKQKSTFVKKGSLKENQKFL
jgi:hypothetical protein